MPIDTRVVIRGGQFSEQNSEDDKSGACACLGVTSLVIFILALCAWAMYIFVGSIIMLADGGYHGLVENCSYPMRNTLLAFIVIMWVLGGIGGKMMTSAETAIIGGVILVLTYGSLASVLSWTEANRSDTCTVYMDDTYGVTSPYVMLINQIVFGWFMTFVGLVGCFIGAICKD